MKKSQFAAIATLAALAAATTVAAQAPEPVSIAKLGYLRAGSPSQLYAEFFIPSKQTHPWPIVMVLPGGNRGGSSGGGAAWMGTPDGREGLAQYFLRQGYAVYVVDPPGKGRAEPAVTPNRGNRAVGPDTPDNLWPQARLATQHWPPSRASEKVHAPRWGTEMDPDEVQESVDAIAALIDKIGGAIIMSHSGGARLGWGVADKRPALVKAHVALDPGGPPFRYVAFMPGGRLEDGPPSANIWGPTGARLTYSPPAAKASDLAIERQDKADAPDRVRCWLQKSPARTLPNLAKVAQHLIVTGEASYHATYDHCTVKYLQQAGVPVTHIRLEDVGIRGNSHSLTTEKNNTEIGAVIARWLTDRKY